MNDFIFSPGFRIVTAVAGLLTLVVFERFARTPNALIDQARRVADTRGVSFQQGVRWTLTLRLGWVVIAGVIIGSAFEYGSGLRIGAFALSVAAVGAGLLIVRLDHAPPLIRRRWMMDPEEWWNNAESLLERSDGQHKS